MRFAARRNCQAPSIQPARRYRIVPAGRSRGASVMSGHVSRAGMMVAACGLALIVLAAAITASRAVAQAEDAQALMQPLPLSPTGQPVPGFPAGAPASPASVLQLGPEDIARLKAGRFKAGYRHAGARHAVEFPAGRGHRAHPGGIRHRGRGGDRCGAEPDAPGDAAGRAHRPQAERDLLGADRPREPDGGLQAGQLPPASSWCSWTMS